MFEQSLQAAFFYRGWIHGENTREREGDAKEYDGKEMSEYTEIFALVSGVHQI